MSWFVRLVVVSFAGAFLADRIASVFFRGIVGPAATAAKTGLFVGTWTAITTAMGIHDAKKVAQGIKKERKGADTPTNTPVKSNRVR